jgi:hypothetical protein
MRYSLSISRYVVYSGRNLSRCNRSLVSGKRIEIWIRNPLVFQKGRDECRVLKAVGMFNPMQHEIKASCHTRRAPNGRRPRVVFHPACAGHPRSVESCFDRVWPGCLVRRSFFAIHDTGSSSQGRASADGDDLLYFGCCLTNIAQSRIQVGVAPAGTTRNNQNIQVRGCLERVCWRDSRIDRRVEGVHGSELWLRRDRVHGLCDKCNIGFVYPTDELKDFDWGTQV